jgi:hypothetical protein
VTTGLHCPLHSCARCGRPHPGSLHELVILAASPLSVRTDPCVGRPLDLTPFVRTRMAMDQSRFRDVPRPHSGSVRVSGGSWTPVARRSAFQRPGNPDHGDAWTRTWSTDGADAHVDVRRWVDSPDASAVDNPVVRRLRESPGHRERPFCTRCTHCSIELDGRLTMPVSLGYRARCRRPRARMAERHSTTWDPDGDGHLRTGSVDCHEVRSSMANTCSGSHGTPRTPRLCSLLLWRKPGGWPAPATIPLDRCRADGRSRR